jgi:prevent-host-death family protein
MKVAATEIKNRFAKYLDASFTEPVTIKRTGREVAVLVSIAEFNRLKEIEFKYKDTLLSEAGLKKTEKYISLRGMMNDSKITDKDLKEAKEIWT